MEKQSAVCVYNGTRGPAGVTPASVWSVGFVNVSREMDSSLNMSANVAYGGLECDMVMLQNYMLMIL